MASSSGSESEPSVASLRPRQQSQDDRSSFSIFDVPDHVTRQNIKPKGKNIDYEVNKLRLEEHVDFIKQHGIHVDYPRIGRRIRRADKIVQKSSVNLSTDAKKFCSDHVQVLKQSVLCEHGSKISICHRQRPRVKAKPRADQLQDVFSLMDLGKPECPAGLIPSRQTSRIPRKEEKEETNAPVDLEYAQKVLQSQARSLSLENVSKYNCNWWVVMQTKSKNGQLIRGSDREELINKIRAQHSFNVAFEASLVEPDDDLLENLRNLGNISKTNMDILADSLVNSGIQSEIGKRKSSFSTASRTDAVTPQKSSALSKQTSSTLVLTTNSASLVSKSVAFTSTAAGDTSSLDNDAMTRKEKRRVSGLKTLTLRENHAKITLNNTQAIDSSNQGVSDGVAYFGETKTATQSKSKGDQSIFSEGVISGTLSVLRSVVTKTTMSSGASSVVDKGSPLKLALQKAYNHAMETLLDMQYIPDTRWSRRLFGTGVGIKTQNKNINKVGSDKDDKNKWQRRSMTIYQVLSGNFVLHPYSSMRFIWDLVTMILLLINMFIIPYDLAFYQDKVTQVAVINKIVSDTWFLVDLFMNFHTGYVDHQGNVELKLENIRSNYLRGWFCVDLIASVPFDSLLTIGSWAYFSYVGEISLSPQENVNSGDFSALTKVLRVAKLVSLVRILRVGRFVRYLRIWEEVLNLEYDLISDFFGLFIFIIVMLITVHWFACLQFLVASMSDFPLDSWVVLDRELMGVDLEKLWLESQGPVNPTVPESHGQFSGRMTIYYWCLFKSVSQMICIGYGFQRFPINHYDCIMTWISLVLSAFMFLTLISFISNFMQNLSVQDQNYRAMIHDIDSYCRFQKLPKDLIVRIHQYLETRYQGKFFDERQIMSELNPVLRNEVIRYTFLPLLLNCPYFIGTSNNFITEIGKAMQFEMYTPGQVISRADSLARRFYFIDKGTLIVVSPQGEHFQTLQDGNYFGELSLLGCKDFRRACDTAALKSSRVYYLTLDDFQRISKIFPLDGKIFETRLLCHVVQQSRLAVTAEPQRKPVSIKSDLTGIDVNGDTSQTDSYQGKTEASLRQELDEDEETRKNVMYKSRAGRLSQVIQEAGYISKRSSTTEQMNRMSQRASTLSQAAANRATTSSMRDSNAGTTTSQQRNTNHRNHVSVTVPLVASYSVAETDSTSSGGSSV